MAFIVKVEWVYIIYDKFEFDKIMFNKHFNEMQILLPKYRSVRNSVTS